MTDNKFRVTLYICIIILIISILFALISGHTNIFLLSKEIRKIIIADIRLPRISLAIFVGIALAISGHIAQILLNNQLASSSTLGTSSGAAFGASLSIYLTLKSGIHIPPQILAVFFAVITIVIVLKFSGMKNKVDPSNVILAGIIVSTIFSALITLIKYFADEDVFIILGYLMGSLDKVPMDQVVVFGVIVIAIYVYFYKNRKTLDIMMLGREESILLGLEYDKLFNVYIMIISILVGFVVSLSGIIGFIGLFIPHISRSLVGSGNSRSLVITALLGAIFLLISDTITRAYLPHQIPVGIITTLIGGIFFIYLLISRRDTYG